MMEDARIRTRNSYVDPVEVIQIGKVSRFVTVGGEDTEHAEELVRRWNSYDALVKALHGVLSTLEHRDKYLNEGHYGAVYDAARDALKLADKE